MKLFFQNIEKKIFKQEHIKTITACQILGNPVYTVAVDLLGPMSISNHIAVVQDTNHRFRLDTDSP